MSPFIAEAPRWQWHSSNKRVGACLAHQRWSIYTQGNFRRFPASNYVQVQMAPNGRCPQRLVYIKAGAGCRCLAKGSCS